MKDVLYQIAKIDKGESPQVKELIKTEEQMRVITTYHTKLVTKEY